MQPTLTAPTRRHLAVRPIVLTAAEVPFGQLTIAFDLDRNPMQPQQAATAERIRGQSSGANAASRASFQTS